MRQDIDTYRKTTLIIIAGSNGSGKTSVTFRIFYTLIESVNKSFLREPKIPT